MPHQTASNSRCQDAESRWSQKKYFSLSLAGYFLFRCFAEGRAHLQHGWPSMLSFAVHTGSHDAGQEFPWLWHELWELQVPQKSGQDSSNWMPATREWFWLGRQWVRKVRAAAGSQPGAWAQSESPLPAPISKHGWRLCNLWPMCSVTWEGHAQKQAVKNGLVSSQPLCFSSVHISSCRTSNHGHINPQTQVVNCDNHCIGTFFSSSLI